MKLKKNIKKRYNKTTQVYSQNSWPKSMGQNNLIKSKSKQIMKFNS